MSGKGLPNKRLALPELMGCGYVLMALDGNILQISQMLEDMLGYSRESLQGTCFFDLLQGEGAGRNFVQQMKEKNVQQGLLTALKDCDGELVQVSINAQYVDQPHPEEYVECLVSRISNEHQQTEHFDDALRNVSGGIAHLINNQMASVVGTADLMKKELKNYPKLAKKLDRISQCGLQASQVTHSLVEYADTSDLPTFALHYVNSLVLSVVERYEKDVFSEKHRKFSYEIVKEIAPCLVNEQQMLQLCACMLDNAVEATVDGGMIILEVKTEELKHQRSGTTEEYVMISIQDDGIGMDADTQKRIFEPYFSTKFMGRGMSLAHALKIMKAHHGRIHVKTGENLGSLFKMYFPIHKLE